MALPHCNTDIDKMCAELNGNLYRSLSLSSMNTSTLFYTSYFLKNNLEHISLFCGSNDYKLCLGIWQCKHSRLRQVAMEWFNNNGLYCLQRSAKLLHTFKYCFAITITKNSITACTIRYDNASLWYSGNRHSPC